MVDSTILNKSLTVAWIKRFHEVNGAPSSPLLQLNTGVNLSSNAILTLAI